MIRPAYWTDADLHTRLSADVREFYIGCWMEADDAGYIAWDPDRLGADLYPYRSLGWRRSHIAKWLGDLSIGGHLRLLDCGRHAVVPNLTKYQAAPKPSYQHQRAHDTCLRHKAPSGASGDHKGPAQGFGVGKGLVLDGGAPPRADENNGATEGLKAKLGDFADIVGRTA